MVWISIYKTKTGDVKITAHLFSTLTNICQSNLCHQRPIGVMLPLLKIIENDFRKHLKIANSEYC
jgi:hypothetical protein